MIRMTSVNTAIDYNMLEKEARGDTTGLPANAGGSQQSKGESVCRICLSEDSEQDNPMISPCKCSGTMKFIHLECLKEWLNCK